MRKLRLREAKSCCQSPTTTSWGSWSTIPELVCLSTITALQTRQILLAVSSQDVKAKPGKTHSGRTLQVMQRKALGTPLDFGTSSVVFLPTLHHGLPRSGFQSLLLYLIRLQNSCWPQDEVTSPSLERTATPLCPTRRKEKSKTKRGRRSE